MHFQNSMFNLEELSIKVVQVFKLDSTKLYDVDYSERCVALSSPLSPLHK
jgi:hypothetical protein